MSEVTLRIIEGLVIYDLFRIFINLTLRLAFGLNQRRKRCRLKGIRIRKTGIITRYGR